MSFSTLKLKKKGAAAALAAFAALLAAQTPEHGCLLQGAEAELRDIQGHNPLDASFLRASGGPSSPGGPSLPSNAAVPAAGGLSSPSSSAPNSASQLSAALSAPAPHQSAAVSAVSSVSMLEAREAREKASSSAGRLSCRVRFADGFRASPTVTLVSAAPPEGPLTAVFLDLSASCWLHGVQLQLQAPSSFSFRAGAGGDFAAINPPRGTGKHRYTVIILQGAPEVGPKLEALLGTPWDNPKRKLGSTRAVMRDLKKKNRQRPKELCRCSVNVSYEDVSGGA